MPQGIIDLGYWGLKQQPYGADGAFNQNTTNDPLICSSGSCGSMTYSQLLGRFPRYTDFLSNVVGFTQAEVRDRTYFTMVYGEAAMNSYQNRETIYIPPGHWYANTEMRSGQNRNIGAGRQGNAGSNGGGGGTFVRLTDTNWKSIHGSQNDGLKILMHCWTYGGEASTTPQPIVQGFTGYEYAHGHTAENMTMIGTASTGAFWDPNDNEVLFMMENAGEGTKCEEVYFVASKGFGVLISKNTARPRVSNCSLFYNHIGAIGIRGGAHGKIYLEDLSGDNNPYFVFMFQAGSNVFGTGPFMPQGAYAGVPGGTVNFTGCKVEAFACRSGGYNGMVACPVGGGSFYGKGGMFGHFTGRYGVTIDDCTLNVHGGAMWTAIEVSDQADLQASFPGQGYSSLTADNSYINIKGGQLYGVQNWLADWKRQRVHPFGNPVGDLNRMEFRWNNYPDGAAWAETPSGKQAWTTAVATHKGIQPIINSAQVLAWTGGTPTFNYHPVIGTNF